ncbi:MAG: glycosyltransferase [Clostridia bacterium]|nr:glycosyltransferase [Clostridia bacterium]MBQ6858226.1 glycosyltransferase [Clostridia bacterium]
MRVSIIMPCYNAARYLRECLNSVLAQTMGDFEAIVIDDGSKDDTLAIAQEYARKDGRIRVLHQENMGVSAARNLGLEHASGEWITFVDGDDLLTVDALETMLSGAEEGVDMVVLAHRTFDENGHTETFIPETRWMQKRGEEKRRAVALRLIEGDSVLNIMCNKLHRRSVIERKGIRLTQGLKIAEDALFNLEAALCGGGVAYVNRVTYLYRMHAASATKTQTAGEYDRHLPWLLAMRDVLRRRGAWEAYYSAYLDAAVLRLYKDGGLPGAVRHCREKALALMLEPDAKKLTPGGRAVYALVRSGLYPVCYPLIYPVQVIRRKLSEAAFRLRKKKEMPE